MAGLLVQLRPFLLQVGWKVDLLRNAFSSNISPLSVPPPSSEPSSSTTIDVESADMGATKTFDAPTGPSRDAVVEKRRMVHVKTKEECRMGNETIDVWCIELPSRHAENILKAIKENIPGQDNIDLQHLRRFARPKYMPDHVIGQRDLIKEMHAVPRAWESTPHALIQTPGTTSWEWSQPNKKAFATRAPTLYLLVCPVKTIALQDLHTLLLKFTPFTSSADSWEYPLEIKKATVPLLAPTTPEQAAMWSEKYWPTFYRKTNPFGAHPATIATAESEIQSTTNDNIDIEEAMALAERAAEQTRSKGYGVSTGCCIVERVEGKTQIIAVAGDARYKPMHKPVKNDGCPQGNPMCHAVMRAVGLVARKRLRVASQPVARAASKATTTLNNAGLFCNDEMKEAFFLDMPLTPLEQQYFEVDNLKPDGYLCLKLEIYLTHEPCVMCSMALVHSRVGRVIFKERMTKTGGLTAELVRNDTGPVGLGYGLCWRKELNWQFMCWEYTAATYPKKQQQQQQQVTMIEASAKPASIATSSDRSVAQASKKKSGKPIGASVKGASEKYNFTALLDEHDALHSSDVDDEGGEYNNTTTTTHNTDQPSHNAEDTKCADPSVCSYTSVHV